ncbi:hypothetical protein PROFUN_15485 [Planoprotostelium fungivorum]|uniref:Uncharacterized protein n=1 Tax=Planoprotostelium fungivorum TaxID=1890364 RepID=A0A2P6MW08_9EUKA|nr:hypothetical protein PROFUN_15485 [Planoprotostelium fungivorum]
MGGVALRNIRPTIALNPLAMANGFHTFVSPISINTINERKQEQCQSAEYGRQRSGGSARHNRKKLGALIVVDLSCWMWWFSGPRFVSFQLGWLRNSIAHDCLPYEFGMGSWAFQSGVSTGPNEEMINTKTNATIGVVGFGGITVQLLAFEILIESSP